MSQPAAATRLCSTATDLTRRALTHLAARTLPWTSRSQHDAYLAGYRDGLRDGLSRR